jgi:hypothetical protein
MPEPMSEFLGDFNTLDAEFSGGAYDDGKGSIVSFNFWFDLG